MKTGRRRLAPLAALLVMLAACGDDSADAGKAGAGTSTGETGGEVMVFAAASLREAMEELGAGFERETGVRVVFNFGEQ
jgi:ABC-type molybdate transport system substrate-binding protein